MAVPAVPGNEPKRLDTLRALNILDTAPEERFDRLTRLARRLFGVPIALVSLVDENRQWFKSCVGLPIRETSRDISFCGHAILGDDIFMIPDARCDERFKDNPLVTDDPNIRFYAGCPLRASNGSALGTLCLISDKPRDLSDDDRALLRDLARMAEQELAAVQLATMDELTALSNRRGFEALAQQALNLCHRVGRPAALLFFDLDGFKQINDKYGHAEGDKALIRFAESLRSAFRDSDVIGRLGGDEFVAVLTDSNNTETSAATKRLQEIIDNHNRSAGRGYDIRYSVGQIAYQPARHPSITDLLAEADVAMYANKQSSKTAD
jgi:diguanylate cyclase (GGDEF)-like protein